MSNGKTGLLPSFGDVNHSFTSQTRQLDLTTEAGKRTYDALSSDTTREVLFQLYDDPMTPSDLAEALDTSLQNVHYHLNKLKTVGLIEVADTGYSAKGNEVDVFAPSQEGVVFYFGTPSYVSRLKELLAQQVGSLVALLVGTVIVWQVVSPQPQPTRTRLESPAADPLVMFLLGGVLVLVVSLLWAYVRHRRVP